MSKNDSSDIGFALACLIGGAIHFREFKEWLYFVIEHSDEPPNYVFDMLDVEFLVDFKPYRIMGFTPSGMLTTDEADAISGFRFLRGISDFEDRISRDDAIAKLRLLPDFDRRVKSFFPFLNLDSQIGPDPDKGKGKGW
jgi:hypothetical protein